MLDRTARGEARGLGHLPLPAEFASVLLSYIEAGRAGSRERERGRLASTKHALSSKQRQIFWCPCDLLQREWKGVRACGRVDDVGREVSRTRVGASFL
jgi:hypothetical protein